MIWQQFKTLVWIRWRVAINKLRKGGSIGVFLATLLTAALVVSIATSFVGSLSMGIAFLPNASPEVVFFLWAAVVGVMLIFWTVGLVTELQRSEVLSLKQLLHLPVNGRSIFLLNFASSFACLTMVLFLPLMIGLAIAQVVVFGPIMVLHFLVVASFVLALTSITYQLRGWLALMMEDKRRAKNIAVLAVMFFIGVSQLPQLFSVYMRRSQESNALDSHELSEMLKAGEISSEEFANRLTERSRKRQDDQAHTLQAIVNGSRFVPPAWLPYSAMKLRDGRILPAFFVSVGGIAISAVCLRRGYQTTLRHCRGEFSTGRSSSKTVGNDKTKLIGRNWLEVQLPGFSAETSAVAMMNLRNVTRAPEARMMFLTPLILFGVMMGSLFSSSGKIPAFVHPCFSLLFLWMGIVSMAQLTQNAFGLDRSGFRAFVLSPIPRSSILLGKNLSVFPISMLFGLLAIVVSQFVFPMTIDGIVATTFQIIGLYLAVCCVSNYSSIWAPTAIAIGTSKKAMPTFVAGLLQMAAMMFVPIASLPQLIACGIAVWLGYLEILSGWPVYTLCALLALATTAVVYWRILPHQGRALESAELKILRTITSKDE